MGCRSGRCTASAPCCGSCWQDSRKSSGPTHLAVIFDASEKTFRNEIYKDYKAHRPPAPEELVPQFPLIRDAVKAFNVACIEQLGFEADDLIATYAVQAVAAGADVTIVSSDKDLMQLVRPGIGMLDTMKNRTIGPDEVREKFGVTPDKVVDVQALAGDSTDNVPGVPGIGVKTAAELINEYGDLETLLARAGEIKQPKRRERLTEFAMQARLSLDLVTLKHGCATSRCRSSGWACTSRMPRRCSASCARWSSPRSPSASPRAWAPRCRRPPGRRRARKPTPACRMAAPLVRRPETKARPPARPRRRPPWRPSAPSSRPCPVDRSKYETVTELAAARGLDRARRAPPAASPSTPRPPASIPCRPTSSASRWRSRRDRPATCRSAIAPPPEPSTSATRHPKQVPVAEALAVLRPLLEDPSVLKIGQNLKYDCLVLARHGITLGPLDDTMLLSYALDAGRGQHGMDTLSERHLGHTCIPFSRCSSMRPAPRSPTRPSPRCRSTRPPNTRPRTPTSRCGCGMR